MHITVVGNEGIPCVIHLCESCAQQFLERSAPEHATHKAVAFKGGDEVHVQVDKLIISEIHDLQLVILREAGGSRYLPFGTGIFEATALDRALKGESFPVPLTYDAWLTSLQVLGAEIEEACIYDLHEHRYYAELRLRRGQENVRIDMRPSDALVMSLKAGVPFLVAERLFSEASAMPW